MHNDIFNIAAGTHRDDMAIKGLWVVDRSLNGTEGFRRVGVRDQISIGAGAISGWLESWNHRLAVATGIQYAVQQDIAASIFLECRQDGSQVCRTVPVARQVNIIVSAQDNGFVRICMRQVIAFNKDV